MHRRVARRRHNERPAAGDAQLEGAGVAAERQAVVSLQSGDIHDARALGLPATYTGSGGAIAGVAHDRALVIPGWVMKAGMAIVRLTPRAILRLASRFSAKPA